MVSALRPDPEFYRAVDDYRSCLQKAGEALEAGKPGDFRYYLAGAHDSLRDIEREMYHIGRSIEYGVFWQQAQEFLSGVRRAAEAGDRDAVRMNLAAASRLAEDLRVRAAGNFRTDPAPLILDVLAGNPRGGTLRLADVARSVGASPAEVAEALCRLVRAGMVRAMPGMHPALSEKGRQVWAIGYEITDLGRRARAGLVPIPLPVHRERGGLAR